MKSGSPISTHTLELEPRAYTSFFKASPNWEGTVLTPEWPETVPSAHGEAWSSQGRNRVPGRGWLKRNPGGPAGDRVPGMAFVYLSPRGGKRRVDGQDLLSAPHTC